MSKTFHHGERRNGQRQIRVRGVRREPADLRKLASALIALAQAQTEAEAQAEYGKPGDTKGPKTGNSTSGDDLRTNRGDAA